MGCLYRLMFPNGKAYIGITTGTAQERLAEHAYWARAGKSYVLSAAIRKYGVDAITVETLATADEWSELTAMERQAIADHGTRAPAGYNMTDGGDGAPKGNTYNVGKKRTPESRARMSASAVGRKHSEESKAKIGSASRGNKYALGRIMSDAERTMRSASQVGKAKGASSGVVGVSLHKRSGKWKAHITKGGKFIHLGYYPTIESAALARASAEREHFRAKE